MLDFSARLKECMQEQNLNESSLTKRTQLSKNTIHNLLKREGLPRLDTLKEICRALNMSLSIFLNEPNIGQLSALEADLIQTFKKLRPEVQKAALLIIREMARA